MSNPKQPEDRKTKLFWGIVGHFVRRIECYQSYHDPEFWWSPDLGYTAHESAFAKTRIDALKVGIAEVEEFERGIQTKLARLRAQLEETPQ